MGGQARIIKYRGRLWQHGLLASLGQGALLGGVIFCLLCAAEIGLGLTDWSDGRVVFINGLGMALTGALIVFWQWRTTVDPGTGVVTSCWGFVVPFRSKTYSVKDFHYIAIRVSTGCSDCGQCEPDYSVELVTHNGETIKVLDRNDSHDVARDIAETLAELTGLPIGEQVSCPAVHTRQDRMMVVRKGWPRTRTVGIILVGLGLFALAYHWRLPSPKPLFAYLLGGTAILAIAVGMLPAAYRRAVVCDRKTRTVSIWRGYLVLRRAATYPFDEFAFVKVSRDRNTKAPAGESRYVDLIRKDADVVRLRCTPNQVSALQLAAKVADFCGLEAHDQYGTS